MLLKDKTVVITGASAGIGRAIAILFAEKGANLALISRNEKRLGSLKHELEKTGSSVMIFPFDVSDSDKVESAAGQIEKEFGTIDIWINNAMVSVFSPVSQMTAAEYKRVTEVTYLGTVNGTLSALKRMLARNKGTIVQVGSALAYRGIPLQSAYCAAKHAIRGFHDSLLSELIHDCSRVKVTMVQLSAHNTPQFDWVKSRLKNRAMPVPPIYQPEVAARAVLWACFNYRREWIIGFPAFKAIWGNKFLPAYADKYLAENGYDSQQTGEPEDTQRENNLWESVDGNFQSHGRFDNISRKRSFFFTLTIYRKPLFYIAGAALLISYWLAAKTND